MVLPLELWSARDILLQVSATERRRKTITGKLSMGPEKLINPTDVPKELHWDYSMKIVPDEVRLREHLWHANAGSIIGVLPQVNQTAGLAA